MERNHVREGKKFFFEPFWAARFRLRFAQSSGRQNQKTFAPLRAVLKTPGTETNKVFLLLFVHKKKFFLSFSSSESLA
jgi:hypothetical protein